MNNGLIKPNRLQKGDTIGIISPAGAVKDDYRQNVADFFEGRGYKVKFAPNAMNQLDYLAGSDGERLSDLINFFQDSSINAIICTRGGYGTLRLLAKIAPEIISSNPKIFVGFSDITALHVLFNKRANLVTFHGPLAMFDFGQFFNEYTIDNFFEILEGRAKIPFTYQNPGNYTCINSGEAQGRLTGGNLAVICALMGTEYAPDFKGKILLLEDIAEPLYKIDRMLHQLKLARVFEQVAGVIFGDFTRLDEGYDKLVQLITEVVQEYKIPVGIGFPAGHEKIKATLPLGVEYRFNSKSGELTIIEEYIKAISEN